MKLTVSSTYHLHIYVFSFLLFFKTRVLVTHGIKWLPYVDRIIAMDKGVVAEVGSYEQLMGHDGAFAKFMKTYLTEHNSDSDSDEEGRISNDLDNPCLKLWLHY